jgi:hypothetical protein
MAGTSTPYEADGEAAAAWINGHGNGLGAQGHQGKPIVRRHHAPVRAWSPVGNAGGERRARGEGVRASGVRASGVRLGL